MASLFDLALRQQIQLEQFKKYLANQQSPRITALVSKANQLIYELELSKVTKARIDEIQREISQLQQEGLTASIETVMDDFKELSDTVAASEIAILATVSDKAIKPIKAMAGYTAALKNPVGSIGQFMPDFFKDWHAAELKALNSSIVSGIAMGYSNAEIVASLPLDRMLSNADAIVGTAAQHVSQQTREVLYEANSDIVKGYEFVATLDNRTTPQCFVGSTNVLPLGSLRGVFKRVYNGNIVVITTASGKQIKTTPNHPILTARGWTPANKINPCTDVVYRVVSDVFNIETCEDIEMPASISALFDAINKPSVSDVFVKSSSETDFHGDGMSENNEVYYASAKSDLRLAFKTSFSNQVIKQLFRFVQTRILFSTDSKGNLLFISNRLGNKPSENAPVFFKSFIKYCFADFCSSNYIGGLHSIIKHLYDFAFIIPFIHFAAFKNRHKTFFFKKRGDSGCSDVVKSSNTASRFSTCVAADNVISVHSELFSGHVYNLHCDTELYIASGIVVHNCRRLDGKIFPIKGNHPKPPLHLRCRSTTVPYLGKKYSDLEKELGLTRFSQSGSVNQDVTYFEWLKTQPASFQDSVLGQKRGKLFRDGGLSSEQFADINYNKKYQQLTLEEMRKKNPTIFDKAGI